jgi:hypothetical protein
MNRYPCSSVYLEIVSIEALLGTKSDTKQKRMEAPVQVQLAGPMKSENTRSLVVY